MASNRSPDNRLLRDSDLYKTPDFLEDNYLFHGKERRLTLHQGGKMSEENLKLLSISYKHPFEKVPEKYYTDRSE